MDLDALEAARADLVARQAVAEAARRYLFDRTRQVNMIDLGQSRQTDKAQLALRVHVEQFIERPQLESLGLEAVTDESPRINGFEVEMMEGRYHPEAWAGWGSSQGRVDPLVGGVSIGAESFPSGTLGGIVRDRATGRLMLLSNWHVLVVRWGMRRGQRIYQPGRYDGGTDSDEIGTLERDAMESSLDAAVALLNSGRRVSALQAGRRPISGVRRPSVGMILEKTGRTTGTTYGRVTGILGTQIMTYGWMDRVIRDVMTMVPHDGGNVSRGGDSGSWWIDTDSRAVVGLHFGGSDYPDRALALDMIEVLKALNVDLPVAL